MERIQRFVFKQKNNRYSKRFEMPKSCSKILVPIASKFRLRVPVTHSTMKLTGKIGILQNCGHPFWTAELVVAVEQSDSGHGPRDSGHGPIDGRNGPNDEGHVWTKNDALMF